MKRRDRKNSCISDRVNPPEVKPNFWSMRSLVTTSTLLAIATPALAPVHSMMTLLASPFCFFVSYYVFNCFSLVIFKKEFYSPYKYVTEWDKTRKLSDWILWLPFLALGITLLFMFGGISDHIRNENVWKAW